MNNDIHIKQWIYLLIRALISVKPSANGNAPTHCKGRQGDNTDIHKRRSRQASTAPVNTKAVTLTTFAFLRKHCTVNQTIVSSTSQELCILLAFCCVLLWFHDDVIKCKLSPHYWSFLWGIHRSRENFPHKGPVMRTLMFRWCGST